MASRRLISITAGIAAGLAVPSLALAAGTISGTVYTDYNSNGAKDAGGFVSGSTVGATDAGVAGVTVRAFNSAGAPVGETTSGADGTYSLAVSSSDTVRVEFETPSAYETAFAGVNSGSSVQFVKAGATGVDYGISKPGEYCQDNPRIVTCLQPASNQMDVFPDSKGILTFPSSFSTPQRFTAAGGVFSAQSAELENGVDVAAPMTAIGATFGVATDRSGNAFLGTYVKRHSPYGPAGNTNAIYRLNVGSGDVSTFVDLGGSLPEHSAVAPTGYPAYSQDGRRGITDPNDAAYSDVYNQVGRAGLGDVDVTPDGSTLLAVEMTQAAPKLWSVPINGSGASATAGTPTSVDIPAPSALNGVGCTGTWHPMGIGVRDSRVLIGGVCGGDESVFVNAVTNRTDATAFILERDAAGTGFTPIAAFSLAYPKGGSGGGANFNLPGTNESGLWNNWHDGAPGGAGQGRSKPMIANVEIMDNGDLAVAFRDRFFDQVKQCGTVYYEWNGSGAVVQQGCNNGAAAEVLRLCKTETGFEREQNGACNGVTGGNAPQILLTDQAVRPDSPLYYTNSYGIGNTFVTHPYTGIGGVATLPGSSTVWTTAYDVSAIYQQGVRALGPCPARDGDGTCGPAAAADGAMAGGLVLTPQATTPLEQQYSFMKGNGLGDLELVCDAAPVQIGNRVWNDVNKNGIQDPDEQPVKGVTMRLYDTAGTVVGTAITDEKGQYYFSSTVAKAATGDGTNVGGGLKPGQEYTVRLDNAADYAPGGPLNAYSLTRADATASNGAQSGAVNSKATLVSGYPRITVPARAAGINNHTFDVGVILPPPPPSLNTDVAVAMGDYAWFDANKDGKQGKAKVEKPLRGVKVTLLNATGTTRARNRAGKLAPVATTDKKGRYLIANLSPGEYRAKFQIPRKYCFTRPGAKGSKINSNPVPTKLNRQIGITPKFVIHGQAKGDTTRFSRKGVTAQFANLTIDAGVAICGPRKAIVTG